MEFIHLHTHSDNSLLDGYGTINEYISKTVKNGQPALALTDHNTLTGIYKFIKDCKSNGIKPLPGVEINIAPLGIDDKAEKAPIQYDTRPLVLNHGAATHLTLLAKNKNGLKNLFKLVKESYTEEYLYNVPRVDYELLEKYSDDLICLSGCYHSEINIRLRLGQYDEALKMANKLKSIFKDDFYIELMLPKGPLGYTLENLIKLAIETNTQTVFTNDVHYANKSDAETHERLMALGSRTKMEETPVTFGGLRKKLYTEEHDLKSTEEIIDFIKSVHPNIDRKILNGSFKNTNVIANKIEDIELEYDSHLRPKMDIPEEFETPTDYLKHLIKVGFKKKRSGKSKEIQEESKKKIREELETIISNDFVDYFLVVQDYIRWSRDAGYSVGVGRGSVGGSEIAYLLDISRTDPIRFDLLFERFISPGRGAIFEIEYEDGTKETINVAEKKTLSSGDTKYIYELNVGDEINE